MANASKDESPWLGCLSIVFVSVVILLIYRGCSRQEERLEKEQDKAAQDLEASDRAMAEVNGMSFEDYRSARWASNEAYANCKTAAEAQAKRDYKADWLPTMDWTVKGKIISVVGHDIRMQNGFGVYEPVTYYCDWDMSRKKITAVRVTQD